MSGDLINLRRRIKSVRNTQKLTKAMKTVSAVKLRRANTDLNRTRPYLEMLERLLRIAGSAIPLEENVVHPLMEIRDEGDTAVVVISADKGLCGAFNSHLLKKGEERYRELADKGEKPLLITIGNKAYRYFLKRGIPIHRYYLSLIGHLTYESALRIGNELRAMVEDDKVKAVEFVYTEFLSSARQQLNIRRVLPVPPETFRPASDSEAEDEKYIFEPDAKSVFVALLPRYIQTQIYRILLGSVASEEAARMLAMDLATRNASDMIQSLTLTMNKMRQASITKELLEIITATEALKQ